jgi:hypothetical protein
MANNRKIMTVGENINNIYPIQTCDIHKFLKEHPFLSQLLRKDGILFECDGDAPSPSKDYGQLQINLDKVKMIKSIFFSSSYFLGYSSLVENNTSEYRRFNLSR